MQRRQLSERRAKDAASSLIREVTGKKERDPNSMTNKQPKCKESSAAGSVQSMGTRIACIPVHRLSKDARMASPKKTTAVAECSPRSNHITRSCRFNTLLDTCTSQYVAANNCRQSVNTFHEFQHAQVDNQVPHKAAEVDVSVKTPEKCCKIANMKKTSSPPIATDLCTVSLSRIVISDKNDLSRVIKTECEASSCRDIPVGGHKDVDDVSSPPTIVTDKNNAVDGKSETDLSLLQMSIVYPSCEQNVFLGSFGLANRAELPQLKNATRNQLHREAGGKLRRSVKPNMAMQMLHQRTKSMRCISFEGSTDVSGMEMSPRSLHTLRENSPQAVHSSDLVNATVKKLSSSLSKRLKSCDFNNTKDSGFPVETCKTELSAGTGDDDSQSSLSILADMALAHLETSHTQTTSTQNAVKRLSAKPKGFVKSKSMVEWSTSKVCPARRSSRNFGVQRRAWHHLLRANPDEHDPVSAGQTSAASSPGREQTSQRTRSLKSGSVKSSSNSVKSDLSSNSHKASLSQHTKVSRKVLAFERKRSQKELTADQVELSKKARHSSASHPVKENSVSAAVPSQSGTMYRFTETGLVHSEHDPAPDLSFISYSYKELECVTPHMCNVCWVNDHMYCRNMKRIARELPYFSGCIHYIACEHYRQSGASAFTSQESRNSSMSLYWTNQQTGDKAPSHGVVSAEDLLCDEDMLDSEPDVSSDSIDGTELLQIQLKARTDQIFRSLGVSELPKSRSPPPVPTAPEFTVVPDEDDVVTPEEYAAEIVINADGKCVQDLTDIHLSSQATVKSVIASRQEGGTLCKDESRWRENCSHDPGYNASHSTCSFTSFDGTSPHEPAVSVKVHVLPVSDNRVVIKYPKYRASPAEYVHLDVTFPDGATDEVVNSYIKNDVARFICEKKSDTASDIPLSVTVVKDRKALQRSDEEAPVPIVSSVAESRCNGLQSAAEMSEPVTWSSSCDLMSIQVPASSGTEHTEQTNTAASVMSVTDKVVNPDELLSHLEAVYEQLDSLQKDTERKEHWRDGIVDILMQKNRISRENRSLLVKLCKEKSKLQSRLESLKNCGKLQNDRNSTTQFTKLLDSLLESESDQPPQLQDKCRSVIRDSCALTPSSSSVQLPALSALKCYSKPSHLAGVLPLPVQNLNLEIVDSSDALVSQCSVSDVTALHTCTCSTSSFVDVTTPGSVASDVPLLCTETASLPSSQQQVPVSVTTLAQRLPSVSNASQTSVLLYSSQHSTALMPANGLVISVTAGGPVIKTSSAQTQRLDPRALDTSKRAVTVAPSTSVTTSNILSSVRTRSGQFVHLTIPPMLNLTGTNIQIRQFVSIPPRTITSGGGLPVCSGTGISSVACSAVSVACSRPCETCTVTTADTSLMSDSMVPSLMQQSAVPFQWFHSPPELQCTPVSCTRVTSDTLSAKVTSCDSVCCPGMVAEVAAACRTPPVCHDEITWLDSTGCDADAPPLSLLHDGNIPDIPTPDPSCSSQE